MKIPQTASAAWAIVGRAKPKLTEYQITIFLENVHKYFGLPRNALFEKWKGSGRPKRNINGVNLPDIRKAITLRLKDETAATLKEIGVYLHLDRSGMSEIYETGKTYFNTGDPVFMNVYNIVKQIPLTV